MTKTEMFKQALADLLDEYDIEVEVVKRDVNYTTFVEGLSFTSLYRIPVDEVELDKVNLMVYGNYFTSKDFE